MPDVSALVTPSVLRWARKRAGYSVGQVANRLGVDAGQVRAWEIGDAVHPTVSQAERLADLYKRPLAFFYLSCPPGDRRLTAGLIIVAALLIAGGALGAYVARAVWLRREQAWD